MKLTATLFLVLLAGIAVIANEPPVLAPLGPFAFNEGNAFIVLRIDQIASDPDNEVGELQFTLKDTNKLWMSVMGPQLYLGAVDAAWAGTETFTLSVCDPDGACAERSTEFTVVAVNDPPQLLITDQVASVGADFVPIELTDVVSDPDNRVEDLEWHVAGNRDLTVEIANGRIDIVPPTPDWVGVEVVEFSVCDPGGECGSQQVTLARTDGTESVLHRVGNAGFVLEMPELKVALDTLFSIRASAAMLQRMRTAAAPFDVDLILVTSQDAYRVSPQIVAANMIANPDARLVAPQDVVLAVRAIETGIAADRCISVELRAGETLTVTPGGIPIRVDAFLSDAGAPHVGFSYTLPVGERSLCYFGDLAEEALPGVSSDPAAPLKYALVPDAAFSSDETERWADALGADWIIPVCSDGDSLQCTCQVDLSIATAVLCFPNPEQSRLLPSH